MNQLLLHKLPGYAPEGKPIKPPRLTLAEFDACFKDFLLTEYHQRIQKDLESSPQDRWEGDGFLSHLPHSLEQLDLLLLTVATSRRVHRDGIYFQRHKYMDQALAAYIGEDVIIRYDPWDMAEIRVFHRNVFLCRAVCQELADKTISLQEIIRARIRRWRELRKTINDRSALIQSYLGVHEEPPPSPAPETEPSKSPGKRLKRYHNE